MRFLWENLYNLSVESNPKLKAISSCPLFKNLSFLEQKWLQDSIHLRSYQSQELLFDFQDMATGFFFITKGEVEILSKVKNRIEPITRLKKGDFLGERALLEPDSRRFNAARATEPTTVLALFKSDLLEICERKPLIGLKVILSLGEILSKRLASAEKALLDREEEA
jgi:CRP-like cAMP-binding protein